MAAASNLLYSFVDLDKSEHNSSQSHFEHCKKEFTQSKMAATNQAEGVHFDNETLMSCVRKYAAMYDKNCKDCKIPLRKKIVWREIGLELGIDWAEAQTCSNSIRTNFSKTSRDKDLIRSGSGIGDVPEIRPEFEHLRWLLIHIRH